MLTPDFDGAPPSQLTELRQDFPRALFIEGRRDCDVVPIDKLLQRKLRRAPPALGLSLRVARPLAFRMPPVLPSKIRRTWDVPYFTATSCQLACAQLAWSDVWLTPEETAYVTAALADAQPETPEGVSEEGGLGSASGGEPASMYVGPAAAL